jgi:hypothetical protein
MSLGLTTQFLPPEEPDKKASFEHLLLNFEQRYIDLISKCQTKFDELKQTNAESLVFKYPFAAKLKFNLYKRLMKKELRELAKFHLIFDKIAHPSSEEGKDMKPAKRRELGEYNFKARLALLHWCDENDDKVVAISKAARDSLHKALKRGSIKNVQPSEHFSYTEYPLKAKQLYLLIKQLKK